MNLYYFYFESNIASALLLAVILYKDLTEMYHPKRQVVFDLVLVMHILYFMLDSLWALLCVRVIGSTPLSFSLLNVCIYILAAFTGYGWYLYSEISQNATRTRTLKGMIWAAAPAFITSLLILTDFVFDLGLWIDRRSMQYGQSFFMALVAVPFAYVMLASCRAFFRSFKKKNYANRHGYIVTGMYPLAIVFFALCQVTWLNVPILCFGCTLTMLYVYISSLSNLVTRDPLTLLNNRMELKRFMVNTYQTLQYDSRLYLVIFDLDGFRRINRVYGRAEGDAVLLRMSEALKEFCRECRSRHFLARYGGDEFCMVAKVSSEAELPDLCESVRTVLVRKNRLESGGKYALDFCSGYSELTGQVGSIDRCFADAFTALEAHKKEKSLLL